jgi:hypothetical protein
MANSASADYRDWLCVSYVEVSKASDWKNLAARQKAERVHDHAAQRPQHPKLKEDIRSWPIEQLEALLPELEKYCRG